MYFLVTTIVGFYQRSAYWILKKHRERSVVNTGLLICAFLWYALGIPFLLSPFLPFMTTLTILLIPIGPLGQCLQAEIKDEKARRRKEMLDKVLEGDD